MRCSAGAGRCRWPNSPAGGSDLASVDPADADRALLLWANSPSNPTGVLTDLDDVAGWGRAHGIPVFSDECYAEFTWDGPPATVLASGVDGVVAVHSLSKRSNLAGVRAGFYAGDPELVGYLPEVRRHAGLMVPGPVQAGAVAAFDDDAHVVDQRHRYQERLDFLAGVLGRVRLPSPHAGRRVLPVGPVPGAAGAGGAGGAGRCVGPGRGAGHGGRAAGQPGELYGPDGATYVRVAVVQPMERLEVVPDDWRIGVCSPGRSRDRPPGPGGRRGAGRGRRPAERRRAGQGHQVPALTSGHGRPPVPDRRVVGPRLASWVPATPTPWPW